MFTMKDEECGQDEANWKLLLSRAEKGNISNNAHVLKR